MEGSCFYLSLWYSYLEEVKMLSPIVFKARFFCGDAVVGERELHSWEGEYFEKGSLKAFDVFLEKARLEEQCGCPISVKIAPAIENAPLVL